MSEQKVSEALQVKNILGDSQAVERIAMATNWTVMALRSIVGEEIEHNETHRPYSLALQLEQDHARLTAQVAELQAVIDTSESTNAVNQLVMAMNKKVNDLIAERDELQKQLDSAGQCVLGLQRMHGRELGDGGEAPD